jgi:hypothetical protein
MVCGLAGVLALKWLSSDFPWIPSGVGMLVAFRMVGRMSMVWVRWW